MSNPLGACPKCSATTVQGQLVPMKNAAVGVLTTLITNHVSAGVLVGPPDELVVQTFCFSCGAIWLPFQNYLIRGVRGELGDEVRDRARRELEALVQEGTGFKLVSDEARELATWAKSVLSRASELRK